jgi:hypothetical protein
MANPQQNPTAAPTVSSIQRHIASTLTNRLVPEIKDKILFRTPDAAPMMTVIKGLRGKKATGNREVGAMFKDDMPRTSSVADATVASDGTTLNVTTGEGARFYANAVALNTTTREVFRVVSVATDALTIARLGNAQDMAQGEGIQLIGAAFPDGAAKGNVKSVAETYRYSYTQIHRTGWELTRRQAKGSMYGGRDEVSEKQAQMVRHMQEIEFIALFSRRHKTTIAAGQEVTFTMGAEEATEQNVWDLEGVAPDFNQFNAALELYMAEGEGGYRSNKGGGSKVLFASPAWCTMFDKWYADRIQTDPVGGEGWSFKMKFVETSHGKLSIMRHPLLTGANAGLAFLVDPNHVTYYHYNDSDTQLHEVTDPGDDGMEWEYLTDFGLLWEHPLAHAQFRNLPATV